MITIHKGDCREVLRTLPAESVHCVVTIERRIAADAGMFADIHREAAE